MSSPHSAVPTAVSVPSPSAPVAATVSAPAGSSATGSSAAAPTVAELMDFVRDTARDEALIASLPLDPEGRTWIRLDGPGGSEAWLIGWPPGAGTGWHDHADSFGAFTTASGALKEHSLAVRLPTDGWKTLELTEGVDRSRVLATGQGRAFGQNHVHEVLNESTDAHAVSVHAYYPPLPRIRRFSRTGAVLRLEQTERPEDWQ
ncbi:cysteine dioxygenase [Streptomyces griseus]|uniref:cysteine dioxygenase n=1 Tax=Streptomyces TaxID=1883 RepID=UPI0029C2B0A3|nr:cysteine dioxygenase [Streptomyces sp. ID01-9D]MDX5573177.1 cysteine dioxygenase [Streptomyces sp. ID01-9D]WSV24414.1 cysteine dioxygenase [Streptomyces fimicarius]WTC86668.1 cysteine dioxygenase [Streptomyces griseus]WTD70712.1 cysteine dioxygenase [Streptomyces griseus]